VGLLIVFTGNGKGKTTAALGQTVRALGHGWKCAFLQFIKADRAVGEALFAPSQGLLDFRTLGLGFVLPGEEVSRHREAARAAWGEARGVIASGDYRLVVLDELTYLARLGFLSAGEMVEGLCSRPSCVHIVVTGRGAPPELIEAADLVTEMAERKHPLHGGAPAQEGIEY
jgi:cob(I)alamin adenosyltransferase